MSDVVRIVANQERRFKTAHVWDCVFLTRVGDRYAPVMGGIAGTVTTRPGELGVVVWDVSDNRRSRIGHPIGLHNGEKSLFTERNIPHDNIY